HDAYAHRRIYGGDLILDAPRVFIETYQADEKTGFTLPQTYPFNPQQLASVSLKSLGVQNANINLVLQHDTRRMPYTLDSTSLFLDNRYMDSSIFIQPNQLFFTDNLRFQSENIQIRLPDSLQILEVGEVGFFTQDSTLFAKNVRLIPRYEKTELAAHLGYQK